MPSPVGPTLAHDAPDWLAADTVLRHIVNSDLHPVMSRNADSAQYGRGCARRVRNHLVTAHSQCSDVPSSRRDGLNLVLLASKDRS